MAIDYKSAGVDIAKGDALVDWLKSSATSMSHPLGKVVSGIGGFSALFQVDFSKMQQPCLVSATDGVGTKIKLAAHFQSYQGVGQDLVAMCVNDLICCGATPLFFLDYYATGQLKLDAAKDFLTGVRGACEQSQCILIGGETAEMPGVYSGNDFDAAGFCVGVVDKDKAFGPHKVSVGNKVIGVASSGFHSNGYSLLRKIFESDIDEWQDELLVPTALYVKLVEQLKLDLDIKSVAHITGGGVSNLQRVLPENVSAKLSPWQVSSAYKEVQKRADISWGKMLETFNCGIGLMLVVDADDAAKATGVINDMGFKSYDLGDITEFDQQVIHLDESEFSKVQANA